MPRPTRQQRRARRREQAAAAGADGSVAQRARTRQAAVRPTAEPAPVERRERGGFINFIVECAGELKKVDWPNQRQVMTGTVAVIIACAIVGAYLYAADLALRPFVERVLIGN
jgi:preprotein translocase SecE subunit